MTLGCSEKINGKPTEFPRKILEKIKIHTFRWNFGKRWKPGRDIHFVTGNRTPRRNQFYFDTCKSIQHAVIDNRQLWIDGKLVDDTTAETVARNDGFDTADEFFDYFSKGFAGKIIHWTDLKY